MLGSLWTSIIRFGSSWLEFKLGEIGILVQKVEIVFQCEKICLRDIFQ